MLFLFSVSLVDAAIISGKVVGVHDGDTLTVLTAGKESVKVRLYGIDAPESKQPFGTWAKQELSDLAFGKQVTVEVKSIDRYKRTVGRVLAEQVDVDQEIVRRGFAWWYRSYAKKDVGLARAEKEVRTRETAMGRQGPGCAVELEERRTGEHCTRCHSAGEIGAIAL